LKRPKGKRKKPRWRLSVRGGRRGAEEAGIRRRERKIVD